MNGICGVRIGVDEHTLHFVINENRPESIVMDYFVAIVLLFYRLDSFCVS